VSVYEDFMCPYCGEFEHGSREWLARYAEQGRVKVRYHPISILDSQSDGTEYPTRAANALAVVLDASGPRVAKKFHDLLFENQPEEGTGGLSDTQLVSLAVKTGASEKAVTPGIMKRSFEQWVVNATDTAQRQKGFQGTPFVQVDGKPFTDYTSPDELSRRLQAAVDAAAR
jgi:protein-disulfide isomerase